MKKSGKIEENTSGSTGMLTPKVKSFNLNIFGELIQELITPNNNHARRGPRCESVKNPISAAETRQQIPERTSSTITVSYSGN